jgi:hypothetical protein
MATNGSGVSESIVGAPASPQGPYSYRSGIALLPSAEWQVKFDDFVDSVSTNVPLGWTAAIIDTGATAVVDTTATTGANGVLSMSDATVSEGVAIYGSKNVQLIAGKRFMMEMRVKTSDVTDNAVLFGLSDLTATTNPEDLWTTTAANLVAVGILDGAATVGMLIDAGNSGTARVEGTRSMVAATWHTLAFYYNGVNISCYVDGKLSLTWTGAASTIPTAVALAPFVGVLNGNGAGAATNQIDYVRWVSER